MTYCAPVDFTISADTSPVYAPFSLSAQFSAPKPIVWASNTAATEAKWMNGVQMTTSQFGLSAAKAAFNSVAKATPSCKFRFIFQLPATIFFLISFLFKRLIILFLCFIRLYILLPTHIRSANTSTNRGTRNHRTTRNVVIIRDADCKRPNSPSSNGTFRSSSFGRLLQLHLLYTVPSFNNTSPGLERTMVFNVISSVMPKG